MRLLKSRLVRFSMGVIVAGFTALSPTVSLSAPPPGKGGGGGGGGGDENLPGTVYVAYTATNNANDTVVIGMNPDGTGKFQALGRFGDLGDLVRGVEPSNLEYGTLATGDPDRWFLYLALVNIVVLTPDEWIHQFELFAVNGSGDVVQLTDLSADLDYLPESNPRWSNDGMDSFVSFVGVNADGRHIWRLHVTVADFTDPNWAPVTPNDPRLEHITEIDTTRADFDWSPDGSAVAYLEGPFSNRALVVRDVAAGEDHVLVQADGLSDPRWSPDGAQIAYTTLVSTGYGYATPDAVCTIGADGLPQEILTSKTKRTFSQPFWSPTVPTTDLVIRLWTAARGAQVARVHDNGSGLTILTDDLPTGYMYPLGWRPNISVEELLGP